jgi:hypothetical protein
MKINKNSINRLESKKNTKLVRIIKISTITGAAIAALSFFISLVPCTGEGLCTLPNPFTNLNSISSEYYGLSNNPISGLVLQFLIPALILGIILMLFKKKPRKIVDFTRK